MKPITDNKEKYQIYKIQMGRLTKALNAGFYLEAVFIEYAVFEDRLESILTHAGKFDPEKHNKIHKKLNILSEMSRNKKGLEKKYFTEELIQNIIDWKNQRNSLIHTLMKQSPDLEEFKAHALKGKELLRILDNKTSAYKRALEKHAEAKLQEGDTKV